MAIKGKILVLVGLLLIFLGIFLEKQETIITYVNTFLNGFYQDDISEIKNEYYNEFKYTFVHNVDEFKPMNFDDLIDVYYTIINSGVNEYTFKCPKKYEKCLDDVDYLASAQDVLSDINNYVHPFNSFTHIETTYDNFGNVTLTLVKFYTKSEIDAINYAVDDLYPKLVKDDAALEENIKSIHDYIILNTKYDTLRRHSDESIYKSDKAYGALYEGYAVCGGYSDTMAIFLHRMGVPNFKVSSDKHVWNAVYVNNQWLNLDLTWDDPVTIDGGSYLEYNFFLIDSEQLLKIEKKEHGFNPKYYPEMAVKKSN